jgi:NAD(P)-dependent dehydrogenase (short-subunit alcohol dehydrogenase family)
MYPIQRLKGQSAIITGANSGIQRDSSVVDISLALSTSEAEASLLELIPYNRVGEPLDIAKAAVWLASDDSDYMHGATLFIDGGMTLYPGFSTNG